MKVLTSSHQALNTVYEEDEKNNQAILSDKGGNQRNTTTLSGDERPRSLKNSEDFQNLYLQGKQSYLSNASNDGAMSLNDYL